MGQQLRTTAEVAKLLNISKDLVKYHRKKLSPLDALPGEKGYLITEAGVEQIRSKLRKENYSVGFEEKVLERLSNIENELNLLRIICQDVPGGSESPVEAFETFGKVKGLETRLDELIGLLRTLESE